MDKRLQRAKINAMSTLVHQLISTCCGMVIPWIMIDTFGSAAYGATTSIAQFLSYISLFEGGIGRVARGALYGPLAEKDNENISRVYLAVKRFFTTLGIIFAGYSIALAFGYYNIAEVDFFTREYTFMLVVSIAIGKFAEYMGGISNITLFNADQKQYIVNSAIIVTNIINTIMIVILSVSGIDILWVKLTSSLVFILKPVFYTYYLKKNYNITKTGTRATLENKFTGIAQHFAYVVYSNTDVLILTVLSDLKIVAVYSVYHLVIFSIRNITSSFTGGMEAVFGNMIAKGENKELRNTFESYKFILTVLSVTLFSATAILVVPFVKLYTSGVTDADYVQPVFAIIMVLAEAVNCLVLPCFNLSIAANRLKESQLGAYGEAIVNLVVSVLLVLWNPLIGVAIGTLAAAVFKAVFYICFSGKNILKIKTSRLLRDTVITVAVLTIASVTGMSIIEKAEISNYMMWIFAGCITAVCTGVVGIVTGILLYPGRIKDMKSLILKKQQKNSLKSSGQETGEVDSMYEEYSKHDIAAYAGYITDNNEILSCTSGGVATALARKMIQRGGYVAGVAYSIDFMCAEYIIINTEDKLDLLKGSKYVEVNKNNIYKDVKELLDNGKELLFFGLPCTVAALRSFLKKEYEGLICVELVCHGPTKAKVHSDYVNFLRKKYNSDLVDFSVRRKKDTWLPGYLYAEFADGQTYCEKFYHTEYGYAFSTLAEKRCYTCKFRGNNRTGDIMIGDFQGATEEDVFWNEKGVSAILVHSENGNEFLNSCDNLKLFDVTFERIVNKNINVIKPRKMAENTDKFEALLEKHDLFYAVKHSKNLSSKIKATVKKFLPIH